MKKMCAMIIILIFASAFNWCSATKQAVFVGDSQTAGTGGGGTTYPGVVCSSPSCTYDNHGVPSRILEDLLKNFYSDVIAVSPRYVFVLIGVNDVVVPTATVKYTNYYRRVLQAAADYGIVPVVLPMIPFTNGTTGQMQLMDSWNTTIIAMAKSYSINVVADCRSLLGQFRAGGDPNNLWDIIPAYNYDGVHLNASGYTVLGNCVKSAVQQSLYHLP
jgi:lysophospholipase L1-like esterase